MLDLETSIKISLIVLKTPRAEDDAQVLGVKAAIANTIEFDLKHKGFWSVDVPRYYAATLESIFDDARLIFSCEESDIPDVVTIYFGYP